ncbi:MAG: hypothetical protein KAX57_05280 [Rhodoferax sp.]|nr:hypothetical protein [Rhodoferax sp.]
MNKQILSLVAAVSFGLSVGAVNAAPAAFTGNVQLQPLGGAGNVCAMLADAVNIGVSNSVVGAWDCNETLNLVQVGTCHSGGSRSTGPACGLGAAATAALAPELQQEDVPGCTYGQPVAQVNSTIPSFRAFYTSSAGGVMQEAPLGARCEAGTLTGISNWQ